MKANQLTTSEYNEWFTPYISTLSDENLIEEFEISLHRFIRFVQDISLDKHDFAYAPGKWTIKDIIQHLIDCERILSYRALCIARNDKTNFPSFNDESYAKEAKGNTKSLMHLLTELTSLRQSTLLLFKSFSNDELLRIGTSSDSPISVRALGFIIIGHQNHHQKIFLEKY